MRKVSLIFVMLAMSLSSLVVNLRYVAGQQIPVTEFVSTDVISNTSVVITWKGGVPVDTTNLNIYMDEVMRKGSLKEQNEIFNLLNRSQKTGRKVESVQLD